MSYYASSARWQSEVPGDGGYISAEAVSPGSAADTVMEQTISQAGLIRIEGNLPVSDKSDGVLSKIYLNGTEIWSSRVGGERSVRWDEKYDTSYFLNSIHVTAEVQVGDKLTFRFNRWRLAATDDVRIDDVRIKYITGSVLSKTTQWKLKKSVVVDTEAKLVYRNGASESADVFVENETTYMAVSDIPKVLGDTDMSGQAIIVNGKEYLPLRDAANHAGRVVVWAAERLVLIHDGIPVFFGFPELSEISTAMKGGGLFD